MKMAPSQLTATVMVLATVMLMLPAVVVEVRGNSLRSEDEGGTGSSEDGDGDLEVTILHINDLHARFEETNVYSGRCTPRDKEKNNCFGGFARLQAAVNAEKAKSANTLYLAGGDYFQGTIWHTVYKWRVMAHFLNMVPNDAMALGNHEFDEGVNGEDGVVNFLKKVRFPCLAANIVDDEEPAMKGLYKKSVVLERGGRKIGIVGYLTTETKQISEPGHLKITDEVTAVREEAQRLKREEGVDIIIAVGHAGFSKDKAIAETVEEVDVVVGGHTNTFLYNGNAPSTEVSVDSYPTVMTQRSGKKVPVVQAYAYGKYLGKLVVTFDEHGEVTKWEGNPILLDSTIEQDPEVMKELAEWKTDLESYIQEVIGRTYVFLDGDRFSCRTRECNLGNLNTDAIVHVNAKYPDDLRWAHTSLAVLNGGGIRASIDELASNGTITMEDVMTMAPFQSTVDIVELKGKHVKGMFEHSVSAYDPKHIDNPGGFLQVSGFAVVYDINLPPGSRVVRLQARCQECRVPELRDIEEDEVYRIAMPSFLAQGGDGYTVIKDNKVNHHLTGLLDTDAYAEYIQKLSPIHHGTENRIRFIDSRNLCDGETIDALATTYTSYTTTNHHNNDTDNKSSSSGSSEEMEESGSGGARGRMSVGGVMMVVMMMVVQCWVA